MNLRERTNSPIVQYTWSENVTTTNHPDIIEASQAKGILDYKDLLQIHFVHREQQRINIFDLLVNTLLAQCINDSDSTRRTFSQHWNDLLAKIPKRRNYRRKIAEFERESNIFNQGLSAKLNELASKVSVLVNYFSYPIDISFGFTGVMFNDSIKYSEENEELSVSDRFISLDIKFLDQPLQSPHHFLNEAKLSAIAISIYLASLLVAPKPKLKLLVLDDVFIGLDMSNRLPLIEIVKNEFSDYQILLMTYDREWYEILKQRLDGNKWLFQELYRGIIDQGIEIPVWKQDKSYLEKAEDYLNANDFKASAVYLRTAFEVILKEFCDRKSLKVKYKESPRKLEIEWFWDSAKAATNPGTHAKYIDQNLESEVELYRSLIMNPLSHSRITQIYRQELVKAIDCIKRLKAVLI